MATTGSARVDTTAVRAIAREYETASSIVDGAVRGRVAELGFGSAAAGRAYLVQGDAVRRALGDVESALLQWARASAEIGVALRAAADRYQDAEARAAGRVG
ncbi:ESX-1 secretion-associated protein [Mycobacterium sp. Y57]|uniref:type VII secretion target n=1 Tax=Mycolicibacterium xanthum TaxID=2796469 RepID=UPI001C8615D6|nr:type VII secretion target [Mycolicibacterium xanthum]MBX7432190.1 ESX-1 secretion-associated protein [Mycolicibacterium xanthum]